MYKPSLSPNNSTLDVSNDSDADGDPLRSYLHHAPEHGEILLNTDGSFTYHAHEGFVGEDVFTYYLYDGLSESLPIRVTLTVMADAEPAATFTTDLTVQAARFSDVNAWDEDASYWQTIQLADVDGDGAAEVCGRSAEGIVCGHQPELRATGNMSDTGNSLFHNENGWQQNESYWGTIRFPDVNGDGRADVCGRNDQGMQCALATAEAGIFATATLWSAEFGNEHGWAASDSYWRTIQFPDVSGDGRADVCGRLTDGIYCALAQDNDTFAPLTLWSGHFSDTSGWSNDPSYWATVQFPDLNGDGAADVCGRQAGGVYCGLATANGEFSEVVLASSYFGDANGWQDEDAYWRTIQFADVSGDGRADVCGRQADGIYCGLFNGSTFEQPTLWSVDFSDAIGWGEAPSFWQTIQLADVSGDGAADVCGRFLNGMQCALSNGTRFDEVQTWQAGFGNRYDWHTDASHWATIQFEDVNGDGVVDLCGRDVDGVVCAATVVNYVPTAVAHNYEVQTDTALTVESPGVLAQAADANGDVLTAVLVTSTTNGSLVLNPDGSFTFTPHAGFVGSDSFTYQAHDGQIGSEPAIVTIAVIANEVPLPPPAEYQIFLPLVKK